MRGKGGAGSARQNKIYESDGGISMGKITVVGLGPGGSEDMTPRALKAIQQAEVIAGYTPYIKLIEPLVGEREVIGTGMMQEVDGWLCRRPSRGKIPSWYPAAIPACMGWRDSFWNW